MPINDLSGDCRGNGTMDVPNEGNADGYRWPPDRRLQLHFLVGSQRQIGTMF